MKEQIKYQKDGTTPNVAEKMREYTEKTKNIYENIINYIEARAKLGEYAIQLGADYDADYYLLTRLSNEGFLVTKELGGTHTINW